ncbi:Coronin-like protein crn1 [Pseudocyphellaria aurata]|nr:Coronin-like protein crn1 [Pseudocyphellaria aurata]
MSGRFVRSSKYRHVFGRPTKKEQCYDNIRISKNAWDTNLVKANPHYISVTWEASGGGSFAVIPINEKGRLPDQLPLFRGHTAVVLDIDWNPFNDSLIASGSDDGKAFIWKVPEGFTLRTEGEEPADVAPVAKLVGHSRKVGHVLFNPAAENILATSSGDYTVKIWDVESGAPRLTLKHTDIVQSLSWSANGSLLVTTSRDKKLRIWDVRQEKAAHVVPGHTGAKNSRVTWMGEHDRIATTGFSRMSDRQLGLWDIRDPKEPMGGFEMLDSISGVCMPFWDDSTQCLYLAGKGDGNIRYFEYAQDKFEFLSEYKSADPQRGVAFLPKRGINTHENEVMRAFKTVNDSYIEPISFIVPRRAEVFQDDIYPPVAGSKPAMSSREWFDGKEGLPAKIDLGSIYAGEEPTEIPAEYQSASKVPASPRQRSPVKQETESAKEAPKPSPSFRGPPPSMKEQTSSIANLASKFADKDEAGSDDGDEDTSSFEEVSKPVDRSERNASKTEDKSEGAVLLKGLGASFVPLAPATPVPAPAAPPSQSTSAQPKPTTSPSAAPASSSSASANPPIQSYLQEIKSLLEKQNLTMSAQSDKITQLSAEVDTLKTTLGSQPSGNSRGQVETEKDERIRMLERELEKLRA